MNIHESISTTPNHVAPPPALRAPGFHQPDHLEKQSRPPTDVLRRDGEYEPWWIIIACSMRWIVEGCWGIWFPKNVEGCWRLPELNMFHMFLHFFPSHSCDLPIVTTGEPRSSRENIHNFWILIPDSCKIWRIYKILQAAKSSHQVAL
jgi:hypothetical protein